MCCIYASFLYRVPRRFFVISTDSYQLGGQWASQMIYAKHMYCFIWNLQGFEVHPSFTLIVDRNLRVRKLIMLTSATQWGSLLGLGHINDQMEINDHTWELILSETPISSEGKILVAQIPMKVVKADFHWLLGLFQLDEAVMNNNCM